MKIRFTIALAGCFLCSTLVACHHDTIEDRAAKEAKEYTERYCPTPPINGQRTDSIAFDRSKRTLIYYYTLVGKADAPEIIKENKKKLLQSIRQQVMEDTRNKAYKDAGFKFRYIYRSEKTGEILLEETVAGK
jgi:hypothetical protein